MPDSNVQDGLIFKKFNFDQDLNEQPTWIPSNLTNKIIEKAHSDNTSAHCGTAKTLEEVKRFYYWPRITVQIRE